MAKPITKDGAEALLRLYAAANRDIIAELDRLEAKPNRPEYSIRWQQTTKDNISRIRRDLLNGARDWSRAQIPMAYTEGLKYADAKIPEAMKAEIPAGFGAIHQQAAYELAKETYGKLEAVDSVIGRQVDDYFRKATLERVRASVLGYKTIQRTSRELLQDFKDKGITAFVDRRGRAWSLEAYSDMAAQTTTMNAFRLGTNNRILERGHDLVRVSSHSTSCPKCAPWQGRTFSLSGKDPEYPPLETARAGGLFHVRCRHVTSLAPAAKERWLETLQGHRAID